MARYNKIKDYTDEQIIDIIKNTTSLSAAAARIGVKKYIIDNKAKELGLYYVNQGLKGVSRKQFAKEHVGFKLEDILAGKHPQYSSSKLKKRLIDEGIFEDKCTKCECDAHAEGSKYSICELHHIDGDPHNHVLENLDMLCPNCHALTKNYKFRNKHHNK